MTNLTTRTGRRGRPLASNARELELVDALDDRLLSAREVARLVYGDARLRGRVERRRQERQRELEQLRESIEWRKQRLWATPRHLGSPT